MTLLLLFSLCFFFNAILCRDRLWYSAHKLNRLLVKENGDWMSKIPDESNITTLAIPGTHDTCSYEFLIKDPKLINFLFKFFGKTQIWTLQEQLDAGIRYLDIRLSCDGLIYHGPLITTSTLESIFYTINKFFSLHPTEGIIMRIQYQNSPECEDDDCLEKNIYPVFEKYNNIILANKTLPSMKQIRSKVYLILENLDYKNALNWMSEKIVLQDHYHLEGDRNEEIEEKKLLISEYLNISEENEEYLIINHCSAEGYQAFVTIKGISRETNSVPYFSKNFRGIIPMDFPGEIGINHIIAQNKMNQ